MNDVKLRMKQSYWLFHQCQPFLTCLNVKMKKLCCTMTSQKTCKYKSTVSIIALFMQVWTQYKTQQILNEHSSFNIWCIPDWVHTSMKNIKYSLIDLHVAHFWMIEENLYAESKISMAEWKVWRFKCGSMDRLKINTDSCQTDLENNLGKEIMPILVRWWPWVSNVKIDSPKSAYGSWAAH